jgi:hypothetical protein
MRVVQVSGSGNQGCPHSSPPSWLLLPSMSMPQIPTFPETMMFTDFPESGLVLKARLM